MKKIIFSGIQPTGEIHLGNYLGAIKQFVSFQEEADKAIYCIVDQHAITVPQEPEKLRENILELAAIYLASGIDPDKSTLFVQSSRPEHTELSWYLNCVSTMGEMNRMTQFKEKSETGRESVSVGLFDYPVLMAADILIYQATHVPVGEDQKQHVELARNIAERFNHRYGDTFIVPEPIIKKTSARIMGLDNPLKKMSKSADSVYNYIALSDTPESIIDKVKKAVTDSGSEVKASPDKPAISNLLNIYSEISGKNIDELEFQYSGKGYGDFKRELAEQLVEYLKPIQEKKAKYLNDKPELAKILKSGGASLEPVASETIEKVKSVMGLGIDV